MDKNCGGMVIMLDTAENEGEKISLRPASSARCQHPRFAADTDGVTHLQRLWRPLVPFESDTIGQSGVSAQPGLRSTGYPSTSASRVLPVDQLNWGPQEPLSGSATPLVSWTLEIGGPWRVSEPHTARSHEWNQARYTLRKTPEDASAGVDLSNCCAYIHPIG